MNNTLNKNILIVALMSLLLAAQGCSLREHYSYDAEWMQKTLNYSHSGTSNARYLFSNVLIPQQDSHVPNETNLPYFDLIPASARSSMAPTPFSVHLQQFASDILVGYGPRFRRFDRSGSLISDVDSSANGSSWSLPNGSGSILILPYFESGPGTMYRFKRFHADGALDTTFGNNGELDLRSKIYLFSNDRFAAVVGSDTGSAIVQYDHNGRETARTPNLGIKSIEGFVEGGLLVRVEEMSSCEQDPTVLTIRICSITLHRIDADGDIVNGFSFPIPYDGKIQVRDNRILIMRSQPYTDADLNPAFRLQAYRLDGSQDLTFGNAGILDIYLPEQAMASFGRTKFYVQADGSVIAVSIRGGFQLVATKLNRHGQVDLAFGINGFRTMWLPRAPDGAAIFGSTFNAEVADILVEPGDSIRVLMATGVTANQGVSAQAMDLSLVVLD